jgi:sterol desaturase/sphingolipid hydroxylase (fatty acid hydroxylase superfamily)
LISLLHSVIYVTTVIFSNPTRLALLLTACVLLSSLEALVPLFRYRRGRLRRAVPNLMLAVGVVLTNLAFASTMVWLSALVLRERIGLLALWHCSPWLQLALGVAGLDLFAYFAHLLLHKIAVGWKFHRVHHSELEVDVTTAFRQHPGETLWRVLWQCLAIVFFGLPFWVVPAYLSLSSLNALLEHANLRIAERFDRILRWLVVTPNMHKVHHSRCVAETDSNYSNIFSVWDRLFGTYAARADYQGLRYGLEGFDDERTQTLARLIREPFRSSPN